ncbi:MAG: DUF975 family protein [Candidatus Margulisbacteria bacterium]|nr:DUF975 family protein [Candidatus Margulisiibacteriota bacterium]
MNNAEITKSVRDVLAGSWPVVIGAYLVIAVIRMFLGNVPVLGWVTCLILTGPFNVGLSIFSLNIIRGKKSEFKQIFDGLNFFGVAMSAYLHIFAYTILWTILFVVPGIIVFLSYSMTFYIIADNPNIAQKDARKKSIEMMKGNKWKLFCLYCRFIGWYVLSVATLGIGFLFLSPYAGISVAKFYDEIK